MGGWAFLGPQHTETDVVFYQLLTHVAMKTGETGCKFVQTARQKNLRAALPRGSAEDLVGNRSLDAQTVASHGPVDLSWTQHNAEGAGGASKPSWLPIPKTRMVDDSLHFGKKMILGR